MTLNKRTAVYTFDEVSPVFGPVDFEGFGPDSAIEIEWDSPITEDEVGADGEVAVSRTNDHRAVVKMTFLQTSKTNDQLSVLANLAAFADGMAGGVYSFALEDNNGTTVLGSTNAWVRTRPAPKFGKKVDVKTWEIRCSHLVGNIGGN